MTIKAITIGITWALFLCLAFECSWQRDFREEQREHRLELDSILKSHEVRIDAWTCHLDSCSFVPKSFITVGRGGKIRLK